MVYWCRALCSFRMSLEVLTPVLGNMSKQRKIGKLRRPLNTKEMTPSRLTIEHERGKGWGLGNW